jgi:hypothetical protein
VFEGIRGTSITGDIAIDDLLIQDGTCKQPGYCDFETDFCTWSNMKNADDFDFVRFKGSTSSASTGPSSDHTLGTSQGKER